MVSRRLVARAAGNLRKSCKPVFELFGCRNNNVANDPREYLLKAHLTDAKGVNFYLK